MDVSWWVAWNGEGKQQSKHTDGFGVGEKVCRHVRGGTAWLRAVGEVTDVVVRNLMCSPVNKTPWFETECFVY
jgi:hypothetical protein